MAHPVVSGRHVRRFDAFNRGLHLALMTSFLGLAATGLPLLFSGAPWARTCRGSSAASRRPARSIASSPW